MPEFSEPRSTAPDSERQERIVAQARKDRALFVDAFRNNAVPGVHSTGASRTYA
ncbi:hypothetical protein ACFQZ2_03605 [Streptomonospora algeriensis]|uniref:Uncharacterized protein n=1 Tax=Streptomonospora algeriensis TaxID=995084 RepID=A0ABW3BB51_9ACTN